MIEPDFELMSGDRVMLRATIDSVSLTGTDVWVRIDQHYERLFLSRASLKLASTYIVEGDEVRLRSGPQGAHGIVRAVVDDKAWVHWPEGMGDVVAELDTLMRTRTASAVRAATAVAA